MRQIKPDPANPDYVRLDFSAMHRYKAIGAPCNMVVEVRKFDSSLPQSLKSVAWTIISLFDPAGQLQVGRWRCPLYLCPTRLGQDIFEIAR